MSVSEQPASPGGIPIRVSRYDRVFARMVASLLVGGFLFAVLVTLWWFQAPKPGQTLIICPPDDPTIESDRPTDDIELSVYELEQSESKAFAESIEMTTASVANVFEVIGSKPTSSEVVGFNGIGANGQGFDGFGIRRAVLPPGGGAKPRWNVVQQADDLLSYQRKLDFFAIEIGAVHKSKDQIWKVSQLATEKVATESSRSAESSTRYFINKRKRLLQWDQQTIAQAGIESQDVIAVHFYPDELIVQMQELIDVRCGDRSEDLKAATFKIAGTPGDYRFELVEVQFNSSSEQ